MVQAQSKKTKWRDAGAALLAKKAFKDYCLVYPRMETTPAEFLTSWFPKNVTEVDKEFKDILWEYFLEGVEKWLKTKES